MRLTTRTNLALRTLMVCAVNPDRIVRKHEVAQACNASENHLAQVINRLAQEGFLTTLRGRNGGLKLGRAPEAISVGEVFRRFEGQVPLAECFAGGADTCPLRPGCRLRGALHDAVAAFHASLDAVTLSDLVTCNGPLQRILELGDQPLGVCPGPSSAAA